MGGGGGELSKQSRGYPWHRSVSLALARPAKQGKKKEERQLWGTEQGMFLSVSTCEGMEGGGGTWSRHVRSLVQGEQVWETHDSRKWWSGKVITDKRTKKAAGQQKKKVPHFFATMVTLWPELRTLPRWSRGSTFGPHVALDTLFHLSILCPIFQPAKKVLHAVGTNEFFGYYGGYYGITGVIPCPGRQSWILLLYWKM